jgi:predicted transcriptional regulator of viral defense system
MAKILNWNIVRRVILDKRISIFTPRDLMRLFGVSATAVSFFVFRNTRKGLLIRLKKSQLGSLYCLADAMPSPFTVANRLYEPSYISFDTALSFHGLIPETVYTITSATIKPTREFMVNNIRYIYSRIKKTAYTGYQPIVLESTTVLMASPEKALADYLYFVSLKKRDLAYERLGLKKINHKQLVAAAGLFNRPALTRLIETIYADLG